jgi:hypothetical protein
MAARPLAFSKSGSCSDTLRTRRQELIVHIIK